MDVPLKENIPTFDTLINLFRTRRSRRQFLEKPVPKELIEKILNWAGRYSATAHNQENVYFTVVQSRELLTKLSDECSLQVSNLVKKFETPEGSQSLEKVFPESLMKAIEEAIPSFKRKLTRIEKGKEVWRWNAELS
jgi:nitroreductase